jgi:hypothetical protein
MLPAAASSVGARVFASAAAAIAVAGTSLGLLMPSLASAASAGPNLVTGSAYLVAPANLIGGHYYESFPGFADFGLTLDGAFALAATGDDNPALKNIVTFLDSEGKDPSGNTINDWTGIGTAFASGGSIGKEALLAEVVGDNPRDFGGHDLITALDASVCARASKGTNTSCAAAGNYTYASSVFDQSLGIVAQLRAGQTSDAAAPVAYLESLQNADGSFPSLIPDSGDQDVDSTAMAVMALALADDATATADAAAGVTWIARQQAKDGGFPGTGGNSVNSAGLAIQALTLQAAAYQPQINAALAFLASEQNRDGGFNADAGGQRGSNVRASTQAVGGAVGTSFGTLHRDLSTTPTSTPTKTATPKPAKTPTPEPEVTVIQPATSATASATPTGKPAPLAASSQPPTVAPSSGVSRALADASSDSDLPADLWWTAAAVAIVATVVIALLLLRRRRLYPPPAGAGQAGPAGGASS